tara:strand:+ start:79 stop:204 length:126 start_codon:yes stop_codon:yes gene_type:complete
LTTSLRLTVQALQREAAAFDKDAFGTAIDAFSSACRRKRIL